MQSELHGVPSLKEEWGNSLDTADIGMPPKDFSIKSEAAF